MKLPEIHHQKKHDVNKMFQSLFLLKNAEVIIEARKTH